jgi:exodeoxyribonuclease-3
VRLVSYNIRHGGLGREEAIGAVIAASQPDLVLLQEATDRPAVERIARAAGLPHWASRDRVSVAMISRHEVRSCRWTRPPWARHAFLEVTHDSGAAFFGIHLSAVHSNLTERRRLVELRALLAHVRSVGDGFHVLAGDFNTLAAGEELDVSRLPPRLQMITWLTGRRIRWQTIRKLVDSGYVDAFRTLHIDEPGPFVSNVGSSFAPRLRLRASHVSRSHRVVRGRHASVGTSRLRPLSTAHRNRPLVGTCVAPPPAEVTMSVRQVSVLSLLVASALTLSGCELVEGIFKAGVWVGVIVVVVIVVGVGALFSRLR